MAWIRYWTLTLCLLAVVVPAQGGAPEALVKATIAQRVAEIERQIARRMVQRAQASPERLPRLETEIDMRLVSRFLLGRAESAGALSPLQVAAYLRAELWIDCTAAVEERLGQAQGLSVAQADGMGRLHKLTYALPEIRSVKELDDWARQLGILLLLLSDPGPEAQKAPPAMRPPVMRAGPPPVKPMAAARQRTDQDLAAEAARLQVSPALRAQIVALAQALVGPAHGGGDRAAIRRMLETALELAGALHANVGVSGDSRRATEAQLAEGLALFMDPRTRSAGEAQVGELRQYGQIAALIRRLELSSEQASRFAPVFVFAGRDPERGQRAIAMIEQFLQQQAQASARGKAPANLPGLLRRPVEELGRQLAQASDRFYTEAQSVDLKQMQQALDAVRQSSAVLTKLHAASATLEALAPFKPRQFGNLERRIAAAAAVIASAGKQQAEAEKYLDSLHELARVARELGQFNPRQIPSAIDQRYAGGKLAELDGKWRSQVTDLASTAASGDGQIDAVKLSSLSRVQGLCGAMKRAAALEAALDAAEPLARWVDWRLTPRQMRQVLAPYAAALKSAVGGYIADSPAALAHWEKVEARYRPLVTMLLVLSAYGELCAPLPGGFIGQAGMLMTPLEGAPFASERQASFALQLSLARLAVGDDAAAEQLLAALIK